MSVEHYENFPVASWLMPARLRAAVRAIYRFARTADDIADEGELDDEERLIQLRGLARQLDAIAAGAANDWPDLALAVRAHRLPLGLFHDLLSAFTQDVTVHYYRSFEDLSDYCRRSANPIGRLLLALYEHTEADTLAQSDAVCSALQLINFWQDVAVDLDKGRIYIPEDELQRFGLQSSDLANRCVDERWSALMGSLTAHARAMLLSGAELPHRLGGRIGFELRLVIQGGVRILERIDAVRGDVFAQRPTLQPADWLRMTIRALGM